MPLCMLGIFACSFYYLFVDFLSPKSLTFSNYSFMDTSRVSHSLDPDQVL